MLTLQLFGVFRDKGGGNESGQLCLSLCFPVRVSDIKEELIHHFRNNTEIRDLVGLISRSALADENRILEEGEWIRVETALHLLPPVCGG